MLPEQYSVILKTAFHSLTFYLNIQILNDAVKVVCDVCPQLGSMDGYYMVLGWFFDIFSAEG